MLVYLAHWMHFRDTELCKSFKFWPISSFYLYIIYMIYDVYICIAFINIITNLIRKLIKYWEAVKLMVVDMFCQNPNFSLEISNFIFANKYCQLFSLKWQADFLQFQENVCQISRPEQPHCLFVILSRKNVVLWRKSSYFKLQLNHKVLFLKTVILQNTAKVLFVYFPLYHTAY